MPQVPDAASSLPPVGLASGSNASSTPSVQCCTPATKLPACRSPFGSQTKKVRERGGSLQVQLRYCMQSSSWHVCAFESAMAASGHRRRGANNHELPHQPIQTGAYISTAGTLDQYSFKCCTKLSARKVLCQHDLAVVIAIGCRVGLQQCIAWMLLFTVILWQQVSPSKEPKSLSQTYD